MAGWLKLDVGILSDEKVGLIRSMPEGDSLFVLWICLLCMAMKKETDVLYIAEGVPYGPDEIATLVDLDAKVVRMGIDVFRRYGMVQVLDDGAIHICNFGKHQALDKLDRQRLLTAERVRRYRQRETAVTRYSVTDNATEEEEEREREKEKSITSSLQTNIDPAPPVSKKPKATKEPDERVIAIITYLNEKAGTRYRASAQATQRHIHARLREGHEVDDFKRAIVWCISEWQEDPKMEPYLRPDTIVGTKMPGYVENYARKKRRLEEDA